MGICVAICWMSSVGSAVKSIPFEKPASWYVQAFILRSLLAVLYFLERMSI
jgi:hypothetical protein